MYYFRRMFPGAACMLVLALPVSAQGYGEGTETISTPEFHWPQGKTMALSLTFDDARLSQVDRGIPLLDRYGVKATFYVSPDNLTGRLEGWRDAVAGGHDIGNHSLLHPCTGNFIWSRERALEDYTLETMREELDSASRFIEDLLGVVPAAFAYPCGQTFVGRGVQTRSYVPLVATLFETGRTWMDEVANDPAFCDPARLTGIELDGKSFREVLKVIEAARENGSWLILAGHEMDQGGSQTSLLSTIDSICSYATDPASGIWIDHVSNIGRYLREERGIPGNSGLEP